MPKYTAIGHGSRFQRPDLIREDQTELLLQWLSHDCTWQDCRRPRFFDMPVCRGHALIIGGRVRRAWEFSPTRESNLPPDPERVVYYLVLSPTRIKIGTTKNLHQRIATLRTEMQYVVALEWGSLELERQRHEQFAEERIGRREDFRLSDRLKAHIGQLQPQRDEIMALVAQPGGYRIYPDENVFAD